MKGKRPIDVHRESAFSMKVGAPEEGAIEHMVTFGDRLLFIKEKAVYEPILADDTDPGRTNAAIPHTQKRVLDIGSSSPLLCRTLLTADTLFKPSYLQHAIDCEAAMDAALNVTRQLARISSEREKLDAEIEEAFRKVDGALLTSGFNIPVIANLEERSETIFYGGHSAIKSLFDIVQLFYGPEIKHADSLLRHVETNFEPKDPFREYIQEIVPVLRFIWHLRNAVAHPKPEDRILVVNFSLQADGGLTRPSIERIHPDTPEPKVPAIDFFDSVIESLLIIFEELVAALCNQHAKFGEFQVCVVELAEERRHNEHVRFSYAVKLDGEWQPVG